MDILSFVSADMVQWITIAIALYGLASAVVRITPTPKDDEIVSGIGKLFNTVFSKTNIANSEVDKLKANVLNSAIATVAKKEHPELPAMIEKEMDAITDRVINSINQKSVPDGLGILNSIPTTVFGRAVFNRIENNIDNRKMKTRVGRGVQRFFQRLS